MNRELETADATSQIITAGIGFFLAVTKLFSFPIQVVFFFIGWRIYAYKQDWYEYQLYDKIVGILIDLVNKKLNSILTAYENNRRPYQQRTTAGILSPGRSEDSGT